MSYPEQTANSPSVAEVGEKGIIALASRIPHYGSRRLIKGIGDDCAVIRGPGRAALLVTVDPSIEGVHFLKEWDLPEAVGAKLLSVGLSDIAAMGGEPNDALLAMMLPPSLPVEWVERFFEGFNQVARKFAVNLAGGDVSSHPDRISLTLTLTGRMRRDEVIYRHRGRPNDRLFLSGTIGDAEAGLRMLRNPISPEVKAKLRARIRNYWSSEPKIVAETDEDLMMRTLIPEPRLALGRLLSRTRTARAMIDLSDGLVPSLLQLTKASRVQAVIYRDRLPLSPALVGWSALKGEEPHLIALQGGEDYELLFAVPPEECRR
ncbi:MAG: thiamine-phosphate kinase, partial [bacterium]